MLRVDLCKNERKERCRADKSAPTVWLIAYNQYVKLLLAYSCVLKIVPFSTCKSFKKLVEKLKRKIDLKYAE